MGLLSQMTNVHEYLVALLSPHLKKPHTFEIVATPLSWKASKWQYSLDLPGTPEAFGSLCTYFMCSINSSPEMQSFWQIGQQLGFGPPTNAVCCK